MLSFCGLLLAPAVSANPSLRVFSVKSPVKHKVYCEITYMPYQRVAIVNVGSTVDAIRDDAGNPKEFMNIVEAINYMAKYGWEIAEIYGIPKGNDRNTYYFLSKEVSNEDEIVKGLNLKPVDQGFLNQFK